MSKGFLLDTVAEENIIASVPENRIWLFASEENDSPVIKGKLPNGSFITFGSSGGTGAFYQCASVDTDAGTWTGYKWVLNEEGVYALSETLTEEGLTVMGFAPVAGGNYSADTLIMANNFYTGPDPMPTDGLVFHASLGSAVEMAETGQELTTTGTVIYSTVRGIPCATFEGQSVIVSPFYEGLPNGNAARSLSAWVRSTKSGQESYAVGYGVDNANKYFGLNFYNNTIRFTANTNINSTQYPVNINEWHHVVGVYDGSLLYLYIDGSLYGQSSFPTATLNTNAWYPSIGARFDNDISFFGNVAAVRIYDRVLTESEIALLASEFTPDCTEFYLNKSLTDSSPNAIPVTNHGLTVSETGIMCTENGYAEIAANALPENVMCDDKDWTLEIKLRCTDIEALQGRVSAVFGNGWSTPRFDMMFNDQAVVIGSYDLLMDYVFTDTEWKIWKVTHSASNTVTSYFDGLQKVCTATGKNLRSVPLYVGWDGGSEDRYGYPFEIEYIKISSAIV